MQKIEEDDNTTNFWKSRNITSQSSICVCKPENSYFKSYSDFQSWKLINAIEVPMYLIEKYRKAKILDLKPIQIYDEKSSIWVIREGFYDFEKGVFFPDDDHFL